MSNDREQMCSLAERLLKAQARYFIVKEELDDALETILFGDVHSTGVYWDTITTDPGDWDGWSVELRGADPCIAPTEEQLERIWALGFSVIRVDYRDKKEHNFSGDWWRVKNYPPGICPCMKVDLQEH